MAVEIQSVRNISWTCCLLALYIMTPGPAIWLARFELFASTKNVAFLTDLITSLTDLLQAYRQGRIGTSETKSTGSPVPAPIALLFEFFCFALAGSLFAGYTTYLSFIPYIYLHSSHRTTCNSHHIPTQPTSHESLTFTFTVCISLNAVAKWPAAGQVFQITKWPVVWYFSQILRNRRNPSNSNYHIVREHV